MTILELVDLASLVACHGRSLVVDQRELPEEAVTATWSAARSRLDAWDFDLGIYGKAAGHGQLQLGNRLLRLALEIEANDIVTRCVAGLFAAHDTYHRRWRATPIGNNMLAGQRIAVGRVSSLMGQVVASHDTAVRVTQFRGMRQTLAGLSDSLIAAYAPFTNIKAYSQNHDRASQLGKLAAGRIARGEEPLDAGELSLTLRSLSSQLRVATINHDLNQQLAEGILGLFGPELFDSFGLLRGTWLRRLEQTGRDAELLLHEWLGTSPAGGTAQFCRQNR